MSIKLHERYMTVAKARTQATMQFLDTVKEYDLTFGEELEIILGLAEMVKKHIIRAERHPDDPEKKGDEE